MEQDHHPFAGGPVILRSGPLTARRAGPGALIPSSRLLAFVGCVKALRATTGPHPALDLLRESASPDGDRPAWAMQEGWESFQRQGEAPLETLRPDHDYDVG